MVRVVFLLILVGLIDSCNSDSHSLNLQQTSDVRDSVQLMAASIAHSVSQNGPAAWLQYFENTPGFSMASDGQLVFPGIDTAAHFINNILVKSMYKINLRWSNIRVDPLTTQLASISAGFHEDITDSTGKTIPQDGYFTGIAHKTPQGWKLFNAHWSSRPAH